ncbi:hypothetical protein ZIOFF_015383 [Zingiber officinale]|uniref:Uncharacterized protein n=1 Tax=Zingiber officinale TaxID=94328 RepID=A0A8J5I1E9_ZINOF|nr:hypothetical protein ZIOFF_015383 [Zingiber officinale]
MEEPPPASSKPKPTDDGSKDDSGSSRISSRTRSRPFSAPTSPTPASSAVPFSWEQRPGIPKDPSPPPLASLGSPLPNPLLPLPPPLRFRSALPAPRKRRSASSSSRGAEAPFDPFAAALALCARGLMDDHLCGSSLPRRSAATVADRFRIFDFYGSCKATCAVVDDATVRLPRPGSVALLVDEVGELRSHHSSISVVLYATGPAYKWPFRSLQHSLTGSCAKHPVSQLRGFADLNKETGSVLETLSSLLSPENYLQL